MPHMNGIEFLEQAKEIYPTAKRALLTAYADTDAAISAINDIKINYYLMKPWDPPDERLYPVIDDHARRLAGQLPAALRWHPGDRPPLVARRAPDQGFPGAQPGGLPLAGYRG